FGCRAHGMLRFSVTPLAIRLLYSRSRALTFRVLHYALLWRVRTRPRRAKRRGSSLDGAQMTHVSALDSATRGVGRRLCSARPLCSVVHWQKSPPALLRTSAPLP